MTSDAGLKALRSTTPSVLRMTRMGRVYRADDLTLDQAIAPRADEPLFGDWGAA